MYRIQKSVENKLLESKSNTQINHLKTQMINYIYTTVDISRFKFDLLKYDNQLSLLLKQKYFVSANFSGSNCLLVFTTIKGKYHSFLVERKSLSYNLSKVDMSKVNIINVSIKLDSSIYSGSIFDGIYIQTKNEKLFVICDIYQMRGQDFTNTKIDSKLLTIKKYLDVNYVQSDNNGELALSVNKLFEIDQTDHLIADVIPSIKDFSVRGISFYPETSGTKLIFMFDNESRNEEKDKTQIIPINGHQINQINHSVPQQNLFKKHISGQSKTNSSESTSPIENNNNNIVILNKEKIINQIKHYIPKENTNPELYVFEMKKTDKPDVYDLNIVTPASDKTKLKRLKIGIAYVPSKNRSNWCKSLFETTDAVLVNCIYHDDKQKWEPVNLDKKAKRPSISTEFDIV